MSPLEPKRGIRHQQNAIPDLPTEIALRWLDEAPVLKKGQSLTKEAEARIIGLKKSFVSMNPESRVSLLVQLARKESETKTRLDADEREGKYAFPEGDVLTGGLIRALPPPDAQRAFWDVLAAVGSEGRSRERDPKMSPGTTPVSVVYDFIEHTRRSFPTADWHDIGTGLLNAYARETRIPEKIREYAVRSYFDHSFGEDINDVIARTENRVERRTPPYLREYDAAIDHLFELQPAITSLIFDERLGGALRAQMLRYVPFRVCPETVREKIAKLAYGRDTSEELARGVIDWMKFPQPHSTSETVDAYDVLEKVVQKRKGTPSLQLYAMVISLNRDSHFPPRTGKRSDIGKFTKALDDIWKTDPHLAYPESRAYELLAKNAEGRRYISEKMIGSDSATKRIAGVYAALRGDSSMLLNQNITRTCIDDIITDLQDVRSRSFCYTVVQRLCDEKSFLPKDIPLLRNLKDTLNTFHDERASRTAIAVDGVLRSLPRPKTELRIVGRDSKGSN